MQATDPRFCSLHVRGSRVFAADAKFVCVCCADTTTLDLQQLDLYWDKIMEGKPKEYHGEAVNPKNLSLWERMLGRGRNYDPAAHAAQVRASK